MSVVSYTLRNFSGSNQALRATDARGVAVLLTVGVGSTSVFRGHIPASELAKLQRVSVGATADVPPDNDPIGRAEVSARFIDNHELERELQDIRDLRVVRMGAPSRRLDALRNLGLVLPGDERIDPNLLPQVLASRLLVLAGSSTQLLEFGLGQNEVAVNTETQRLVYGDGNGGFVDPSAAAAAAQATDAWSLRSTTSFTAVAWQKAAKFVYINTGNPSATVRSSTGYARVLRWDGSLGAVGGSGAAGSNISLNFGTSPASPYNTRIPKFFAILPCNSAGTAIEGDLTQITCSSSGVTVADLTDLPELTLINLSNNDIAYYNCRGHEKVTSLNLSNNRIAVFSATGLSSALVTLNYSGNPLSDTTQWPVLSGVQTLDLGSQTASVGTFDFTKFPALVTLTIRMNNTALVAIGRETLQSLTVYNAFSVTIDDCPELTTVIAAVTGGWDRFTFDELPSMTSLVVGGSSFGAIAIPALPSLQVFNAASCGVTSLDPTAVKAHIRNIEVSYNSGLTTIVDLDDLPELRVLRAITTNLSGTIDLSTSTQLQLAEITAPITGFIAASVNIHTLKLSGGQLTSVRAPGMKGGLDAYYDYCVLSNNQLNAAALDQFYTDLGTATPTGYRILVTGNPGTATDTPSIATGKGFVVVGT